MTLLEQNTDGPTVWKGNLPVTSRYTYGLAGERFFRALKEEGRILGSFCPDCERTYVPGVIYCERCMAALDEWADVGLIGEVHTFTFLFENYDGSSRQVPEIVAFIRLGDGGLVHRLGGVKIEEVEIGLLVEAVLLPTEEREGAITDIAYFKPV